MLRIGFRAHDLGSFSSPQALGERLRKIKEESLIQLALGKAIPSSRPWQEWDEEYIASISQTLGEYGVSIAVVGCYINPIHPDKEKRKAEIERFRKTLSLTKAFGCPYAGTETGTANPSGGYSIDTSDRRNFGILKESLAQMVEAAEKQDACVAIEAVSRTHSMSSPERLQEILECFPSDHLKVIFDPVNLLPWTGIPEKDGVPLRVPTAEAEAEWVRSVLDIIGSRLAIIHCKDYRLDEEGRKIWNLPALTGQFRWKSFAEELHRRSIDVPWLLENLDPQTVGNTTEILERY